MRRACLLVFLFVLAGCASFSIVPLSADRPEQVWQAKAVRFDDSAVKNGKLSAIVVDAPDMWVRSERSGVLPFGAGRGLAVTRNAWRAVVFFPDRSEMETSALLAPENHLLVLLPGINEEVARVSRVVVLSGLSEFALDLEGREYGNEPGFDLKEFLSKVRAGFLSVPTPRRVENLNQDTKRGQEFLRKFFTKFSERKVIDGNVYFVASDTPSAIADTTHGFLSMDDRIVTNMEAMITPGMSSMAAAEAIVRTVYETATAKPSGPYRKKNMSSTSTMPEREKVGDQ